MISVVLPCLNETRHGYLPTILENLRLQRGEKQLIAALGPCQDNTRDLIAQYAEVQIIDTPAQNRAQRLNAGIAACQGEIILLHHPATLLPPETALTLIDQVLSDPAIAWGGFQHRFDLDHWLLRWTSWYSNTQRPRRSGILYLDHCIFVRRSVLQSIGGVPDMDIFEDTALSQALNRFSPPVLAAGRVITSARRFRERGVCRHACLNQLLKLMYHARLNPKHLNWLYERKSQINVAYSADIGVSVMGDSANARADGTGREGGEVRES
jgi:glycosyltransferase involved in cell wall biosynthesis